MSWKDGFNAALLRFLQQNMNKPQAAEVTDFTEGRQVMSYCDTCGYDTAIVEITYKDRDGCNRIATWEGSFSLLIGELTEEDS